MRYLFRHLTHAWVVALLGALIFVLWINSARLQRVAYLSSLANTELTLDPSSPTGYAGSQRKLILPEHNSDGYQWIAQTQQMLARGEARVRHVDYDNAPFGRMVLASSPYRWWLGLLAGGDHLISGRPAALSVERAAQFANPVFLILLLIVTGAFVTRRFGSTAATVLVLGGVGLYPFSLTFLGGVPDEHPFSLALALWSILPLLAGACARLNPLHGPDQSRRIQRDFTWAGMAGGLGLWINIAAEGPILLGLACGAWASTWFERKNGQTTAFPQRPPLPWHVWGLAGAATTFAAYLIEYFPRALTLRMEVLYPLYGVAWLGAAHLLGRASSIETATPPGSPVTKRRGFGVTLLSLAAVLIVPLGLLVQSHRGMGLFAPFASPLLISGSTQTIRTFFSWMAQEDDSRALLAVGLPPLLLTTAAIGVAALHKTFSEQHRSLLLLSLGPAFVTLGFATADLRWWTLCDAALLGLTVALFGPTGGRSSGSSWPRSLAVITAGLGLLSGVLLLLPKGSTPEKEAVSETDVVALVERDLAHWMANRAGASGAVVFAPPRLTTSLYFHGGLRGIGTPYWENSDGLAGSVRIAGASSPDEAQALIQRRGITHIVMPSWDPFLDEYARLGTKQTEDSLIGLLHRWLPPRWLRPVPYALPKIPGFENQSVAIFEVVEVQENVVALSRLAEYFVEMEQLELAASVGEALQHSFATDPCALVAVAQVARARNDREGFSRALKALESSEAPSAREGWPWDRRVSLALVLTEGKRFDQAREQVRRCLEEMDEAGLRSLTTVSLYRLQIAAKAFRLPIQDPRLRALARALLPAESREAL